jgi:hypothetical protein
MLFHEACLIDGKGKPYRAPEKATPDSGRQVQLLSEYLRFGSFDCQTAFKCSVIFILKSFNINSADFSEDSLRSSYRLCIGLV